MDRPAGWTEDEGRAPPGLGGGGATKVAPGVTGAVDRPAGWTDDVGRAPPTHRPGGDGEVSPPVHLAGGSAGGWHLRSGEVTKSVFAVAGWPATVDVGTL
ncbi:hypothetical protein GCM10029964_094760 [Kibdelosporangium lantanae]